MYMAKLNCSTAVGALDDALTRPWRVVTINWLNILLAALPVTGNLRGTAYPWLTHNTPTEFGAWPYPLSIRHPSQQAN